MVDVAPPAQVLPHERGSGHADGEAGQEAERFNADGNIVDAQHAFNRQFTDDGLSLIHIFAIAF